MPDVLEPPPQTFKPPFFTKQNASHYAQLGAQARWSSPKPDPLPAATVKALPAPLDQYAVTRLARVRAQLDRIDDLASKTTDSKQLKELADASARWSAQEFALAGRQMPGTMRPGKDGARGDRGSRPAGESMLDLGRVSVAAPPPASEVSPAPLALPATVDQVAGDRPPSAPFRLPGDVTP